MVVPISIPHVAAYSQGKHLGSALDTVWLIQPLCSQRLRRSSQFYGVLGEPRNRLVCGM